MEKVYRERGFDFREYKETTLSRRLERRLHAQSVKTYAAYGRILDQDPAEYDKLFNDLTIKVTSFFRDEVAFKALAEVVLPTLIKRRIEKNKDLRVWSAGCATGQESYSIAMLLMEMLGMKVDSKRISVLATDVDPQALARAKEGIFPCAEVEAVRSAWRRRYFISRDDCFRAKPALKQLVTFRVHNLVNEAPYKDLDLVVCRNVLIYFSLPLQMQVLRDFYNGLRRGGFLLLGKAEIPLGEATALFEPVNKKAKLFKKVSIHRFKEKEEEPITRGPRTTLPWLR